MYSRFFIISLFMVAACINTAAQLDQGTANIQIGSGWTSVIIESTAETASGYLINSYYEKWLAPQVGIGGSLHYLRVHQDSDRGTGTFTSIPLYANGKYYFGKEKFRVFVMGSLGLQLSWRDLESTSGDSGSDNDWGFTAGGGAGLVYTLSPKVLLNLNYSLYWIKNAYYSNGIANTFSLNVGYIIGN